MYLTPKQAKEKFGYHPKTLANWADQGKIVCIKSPGGHRRYLLSSIEDITNTCRETILYARVSTSSQKPELENQIKYLGQNYPNCRCISEIGSGMNFKRKKFLSILEKVIQGEIETIVVAHKDRLARFGFDLIEWFCSQFHCQVVVLNNTYQSPRQEMMDDFMAIMHCFSSKLDFLRKSENDLKQDSEKSQ